MFTNLQQAKDHDLTKRHIRSVEQKSGRYCILCDYWSTRGTVAEHENGDRHWKAMQKRIKDLDPFSAVEVQDLATIDQDIDSIPEVKHGETGCEEDVDIHSRTKNFQVPTSMGEQEFFRKREEDDHGYGFASVCSALGESKVNSKVDEIPIIPEAKDEKQDTQCEDCGFASRNCACSRINFCLDKLGMPRDSHYRLPREKRWQEDCRLLVTLGFIEGGSLQHARIRAGAQKCVRRAEHQASKRIRQKGVQRARGTKRSESSFRGSYPRAVETPEDYFLVYCIANQGESQTN